MEPMTSVDFPMFCRKLGFHYGVGNHTNKIWVFWKNSISGQLLRDTKQNIVLRFSSPFYPSSFIPHSFMQKVLELRKGTCGMISESLLLLPLPSLVGGDFNCFLSPDDRIGSNSNRTLDMIEFGQMISDCGIVDADFEGNNMNTWVRNGLMERLYIILLNGPWDGFFPKSSVIHLPRVQSDHAILLFQASLTITRSLTAFRYMKMWARHQSFLSTVAQVLEAPIGLSRLLNLHHKLVMVKQKLKWWNKNVFGNIFAKLKEAETSVSL
ncbi:hypothetical protein DH2020_012212 [Rehmannia glutinosa]|uniref:Endonuclease/exonuclease/phosphatase domain-containing protein n=1 Tax=Rehmannia glutinosa TaxID=99300 RepID=A0ABR0WYN9_REHGL